MSQAGNNSRLYKYYNAARQVFGKSFAATMTRDSVVSQSAKVKIVVDEKRAGRFEWDDGDGYDKIYVGRDMLDVDLRKMCRLLKHRSSRNKLGEIPLSRVQSYMLRGSGYDTTAIINIPNFEDSRADLACF